MTTFSADKRKTLVDLGQAMPDGGFPIRNASDLKNAIQSYGRANDKPEVKAWIIKRAKELKLEKMLPFSWTNTNIKHSDDYISHHGVLGMKWGHRKVEYTPKHDRPNTPSTKSETIRNLNASKNILDSSSKILQETRKVSRSIDQQKTYKPMDLSSMTDQQLRDRINRSNLENQYTRMFGEEQVNRGKQYTDRVLELTGTSLAIGSSALAIALAIKQLKG